MAGGISADRQGDVSKWIFELERTGRWSADDKGQYVVLHIVE